MKLIATWGIMVSSIERKTSDAEDAVLRMARVNSNVFLVRIASGRPAKQAKKRGARVRERW